MDCAFCVVSKNWCYIQSHLDLFLCLGARSFIIFHFLFSFMINLELIFVKDIRSVFRFNFFLHVDVQFFQNHLFKMLSFLHCSAFAPAATGQLTIFTWVCFCSIDLLCLFFHKYHTVSITVALY